VAAARSLFAVRGYQDVATDEIVRAAGVTRGALYHHYGDKQGLFRAVVEELERELTEEVSAAFTTTDPLGSMAAALDIFLDICLREDVRRITLTDAPAVLGWSTWREIESEQGLGLLVDTLTNAIEAGLLKPQPVRALAQLVQAAVMEAAHMIGEAEDPVAARADVQEVLGGWFGSLVLQPDK
jgi:AcrR family transcriptional regulator